MNKNLKKNILLFIIVLAFYLFFAFFDGVVISNDSDVYIKMFDYAEPFYPLLLAGFRYLFGVDRYLFAVAIFQSILMALSTYYVSDFVDKYLNSKWYIKYISASLILFISLLCRFAANRSAMFSNGILTEGMAYPLFLFFFVLLMKLIYTNKNKYLVFSSIISLILISIRKQMYITLALLVLASLYIFLFKDRRIKQLIKIIVVIFVVFGGSKLFDTSYMMITKGINTTHTSDNRFLATMVFYTSEKEFASNIEDKDIRDLYLSIYDVCEKEDLLKNTEGKWFERVSHFEKCYDKIQLSTMWPMVREYVKNNYDINGGDLEVKVDEINSIIINSLLPSTLPEIIRTFIDNVAAGLMITVSADRSIFMIYAIVAYLIYCLLLAYQIMSKGFNKKAVFSIFTLLSIAINVVIVAFVIFAQTRYTIYNMGLFYISGLLLLYDFLYDKLSSK